MTAKVEVNERTAGAQNVHQQPDGPGLRIGKKAEITGIMPVLPGGAAEFRKRVAKNTAEAAYWEDRIGTVHDFKIIFLENDTKLLFSIVYDGDFEAYLVDIFGKAGPWMDSLFLGVIEGYKGANDPSLREFIKPIFRQAEFFYTHKPELSRHDIEKNYRLAQAVDAFLQAAT